MSSLRVETLRLCWLEAFVEVAETENISEASRNLGYDQGTASRYLQRLEGWLGKRLIEPGKVFDPQNAQVSIGLTDEGREFREIAVTAVEALTGFRTETARRRDLLDEMAFMLAKMRAAFDAGGNPRIAMIGPNITGMEAMYELMAADTACEVPFDGVKLANKLMRRFFGMFEKRIRKSRPASATAEFGEESFRALKAQNQGASG